MISIIKREFKNYFSSPLGYAVLCVLMFFGGFYYSYAFSYGSADMTYVFNSVITIVFFVVPVITMRLFSEEKRLKTDQLLLTAPVSIFAIVVILGKHSLVLSFIYFLIEANITWSPCSSFPCFLRFISSLGISTCCILVNFD